MSPPGLEQLNLVATSFAAMISLKHALPSIVRGADLNGRHNEQSICGRIFLSVWKTCYQSGNRFPFFPVSQSGRVRIKGDVVVHNLSHIAAYHSYGVCRKLMLMDCD